MLLESGLLDLWLRPLVKMEVSHNEYCICPYQLSMHMDHPYQPLDVCMSMSVNVPPLEPIGSAKPKLSQESDILRFKKNVEEPLALLCPAQGSPLPAFRLVVLQSCHFFRANWYSQAQAVPKVGLSTILRGSERTNISALPSTGFSDPIIQVGHNTRPPIIHVTEPIGTAKPKFSLKSDSQTFTELSGEPTALLCPAQASPLPTVRY